MTDASVEEPPAAGPGPAAWDGYHEHQCRVLPAFRRDVLPLPVPDSDSAGGGAAAVGGGAGPRQPPGLGSKPTGFQKRSRMMRRAAAVAGGEEEAASVRMCNHVLRGRECKFGDTCGFSHDVKAFLDRRPPDLPGVCPVLKATGRCPVGFACKWVGSHLDPDVFRGPTAVPVDAAATEEDHTEAPPDVKARLQRKSYIYTKEHRRHPLPEGGRDRRPFSLEGKVYVAPLTTVGNLPFRRLLVRLGADVTCGEMAMAYQLVRGSNSEWALLKRHPSEKHFGVQIAGCAPEELAQAAELISRETNADFIDVNMGCPIDLVTRHGCGSALLTRPARIEQIVDAIVKAAPDVPLGLKLRTGWEDDKLVAHQLISRLQPRADKLLYMTVHGRTRAQRYTKTANWQYIAGPCAQAAAQVNVPLLGNGDVISWVDYHKAITPASEGGLMDPAAPLVGALVGRGALIKPWICTEIKEKRDWDISASERFDLLKEFCGYGLDHWGADERGVETTRRYALEWMSFSHRYVPIGLCEPDYRQHMNDRPPYYEGRSDLETLLASPHSKHWEQLVERILGPAPEGHVFVPKHKANAW